MTDQKLSTLVQGITSSNVEMNLMMFETPLKKKETAPLTSEAVPPTPPIRRGASEQPPTSRNFAKCIACLDGTSCNADELEALIDAIE